MNEIIIIVGVQQSRREGVYSRESSLPHKIAFSPKTMAKLSLLRSSALAVAISISLTHTNAFTSPRIAHTGYR